ncbi:MAG: type II toxin-antitoxin system VapC family toxin [Nitrososphaera sp.]|uniref:type II toxin-antitoxin system VapC family toxin n=1 Tax=Nitrososphaera sp. TaxID=1971748 RepID=UPI003D6E6400
MFVADSSYLVEGLLKDASLLEHEAIVAPDIALYEVINAVWKHEAILKDLKDGRPHLGLLFELASTNAIRFVKPDAQVTRKAYELACEKRCTFYDAIFAALARELGVSLETFDEDQRRLLR